MKKYIMLLAVLALAQLVCAAPAKRVLKKVRQSDGTTLMVMLRGDEHLHYYATMDGVPVMRAANGDFTYARLSNGQLSPSTVVAHAAPVRPAGEQTFALDAPALRKQLSQKRNERLQPVNAVRAAVAEKRRMARRAPMLDAAQENKKGPIILVNFKDKKLQETSTVAAFDRFANTDGLTDDVNYGSIHDYFKAQSYGKFNVTFDIAGPVTVSKNMSYYGKNDKVYDQDEHPEEMVYEAVKLVDSQVNFKDYDWDGDGTVENIYVVYAGYGEASGADENTIWPHQWQLSGSYRSSQLRFDGVQLDTYACGSELMGDGYEYDEDGYPVEDRFGNYVEAESGELDGIGTMCHEFSHCLGLPDFYDTDYTHFGMDMWSVLDAGCYNCDGFSPANYTAYERWFSGWLEPTELTEPADVKDMPALASEPVAYVIYNDKNRDEYFLLENRQPIGFDWGTDPEVSAIMTHGLMITHVTYDQNAWYTNTVNNDKMQRMTIVPADNELYGGNDLSADLDKAEEQYYKDYDYSKYVEAYYAAYDKYLYGLCSDLWPNASYDGETLNRNFTDDSQPAAALNTANSDDQKLLHKPVTEITETASGARVNGQNIYNISFKFMGGKSADGVTGIMPAEPADTEWYDLRGHHVMKPSAVGTYIMRRGAASRKVIIK
ncbi:MAG: M6 family metalloprotease domain-containing protein [Bacteroidaceae bacterium]|nr:M6 family metalloprotease domain-containing protein [Bacteroidaceae bacterium]